MSKNKTVKPFPLSDAAAVNAGFAVHRPTLRRRLLTQAIMYALAAQMPARKEGTQS